MRGCIRRHPICNFHRAGAQFDVKKYVLLAEFGYPAFWIFVSVFSRIIFQPVDAWFSPARVGTYFEGTSVSSKRIKANALSCRHWIPVPVRSELFFIYWSEYREYYILFTVFRHLALTVAIECFYQEDVIIPYKSNHCSVRRKTGACWGAPSEKLRSINVVCRYPTIGCVLGGAQVMYGCMNAR